jgi:hypothetical protein
MEELLSNPETFFYHLTTNSQMEGIRNEGLKAFNHKGISVIRTADIRVLNSLIVTQLQDEKVKQENHFVLLSLPQKLNDFTINEVRPDLVTEWTWPLHNNIVGRTIPFNCLNIVCEFSVQNWDVININDFKHQQEVSKSDMYINSFNLIYLYKGKKYKVNNQREIQYL